MWRTAEDHLTEVIGVLALFAASAVVFLAFLGARRRTGRYARLGQAFLLALTIVFFVGAGEEISWGQAHLRLGHPERAAPCERAAGNQPAQPRRDRGA